MNIDAVMRLAAAGDRALEVKLRTPAAYEAIAEMTKVDGAVVGAGTVLSIYPVPSLSRIHKAADGLAV